MDCRSLLLVGTTITDEGLKYMKDMKSLEHLEMGNTRVTDDGIPNIASLPNLLVVTVGGTKVSENGLRRLKEMPAGLQGLGFSMSNVPNGIAFLSGCPLNWLGIDLDPGHRQMSDAFAESLTRFPTLRDITFVNLDMTATQARYIGKIHGLTRLTFFASSGWSGEAFSEVAQLLKLEALFIIKTDSILKEADLQHLAALTRLKTLELQSESIQPAIILKLQAALPDCKISVSPELQRAIDELRKGE
ncbi:MAG TPA: hypothetical protein VMV10_02385 [Pirellulales bacterium]|nr:hypothetical protein [Pirellulales bacterium]